jgi:hypothetical protein
MYLVDSIVLCRAHQAGCQSAGHRNLLDYNLLQTATVNVPARTAVADTGALVVAAAQPAPTHLLTRRAVAITAAPLAGMATAGAHIGALALAADVWQDKSGRDSTCSGTSGTRQHSMSETICSNTRWH